MKSVLITGGTGLLGKRLSEVLLEQGYEVRILTRNVNIESNSHKNLKHYFWNPDQDEIDIDALKNLSYIIHLAGATVAKRWTVFHKKNIIDSRVKSTQLLFDKIYKNNLGIEAFVSASAVGYYQQDNFLKTHVESDEPGKDFLAQTCILWEDAANQFNKLGIRTVKLRTGIILSKTGGALEKMLPPFKMGIGSPLASGQQRIPWIHIDDLCSIYIKALEDNNMTGSYNAVAPEIVTNATFSKVLANQLNKGLFPLNVPGFVLKLAFGEMSNMLTKGSGISSEKVQKRGYTFQFASLEKALTDLMT